MASAREKFERRIRNAQIRRAIKEEQDPWWKQASLEDWRDSLKDLKGTIDHCLSKGALQLVLSFPHGNEICVRCRFTKLTHMVFSENVSVLDIRREVVRTMVPIEELTDEELACLEESDEEPDDEGA